MVLILPNISTVASENFRESCGTAFAFQIVVSALFARVYSGGGLRPPPRPKSFVFKGLQFVAVEAEYNVLELFERSELRDHLCIAEVTIIVTQQ